MTPNFTTRIIFLFTAALVVFGSLAATLLIYTSEKHEREVTQRIHTNLAQHVVDNYLLYQGGKPDYEEAKRTFHDLMILGANFEFYLLNKHGEIVAFDADPNDVKHKKIDLEPIRAFLERSDNRLVLGVDPKNSDKKKVFSVAPIIQMGDTYGYLYVIIGSAAHDTLAEEAWYKHVIQFGLGLLLISVLGLACIFALVLGYITLPLTKLTKQIRTIKAHGFSKNNQALNKQALAEIKNWPKNSSNDIEFLGHTLYEALNELQSQYKHIVSIDDLRKELLSHVSHDLRTPLASLLGYLETWEMHYDELSPETSKEYIATARKSAQKIATLIEQLFELAHLDGQNVTVRNEPVAIAELIQDVLQKFAISAHNQGVDLSVKPRDSSIVVRADIEKLERVFTNLIENALRHTPAGGKITVKIQRTSGFVSIHVSDTGIGIPKQDLPHIFDPHYKAGNSVRENTAHGGLGLAITKKLLELHKANIEVASNLNQGTTFSFSLQSS